MRKKEPRPPAEQPHPDEMHTSSAARLLRLREDVVRRLYHLGLLEGRRPRPGGWTLLSRASVLWLQAELDRPGGVVQRGAPGCVRLMKPAAPAPDRQVS